MILLMMRICQPMRATELQRENVNMTKLIIKLHGIEVPSEYPGAINPTGPDIARIKVKQRGHTL